MPALTTWAKRTKRDGVTIRDSIGRMSKASRINLGEEDKTTTLIQGTGLTTKSKTVISNLGKVDKTSYLILVSGSNNKSNAVISNLVTMVKVKLGFCV